MPHLSLLTLPRTAGRWRFLSAYQLHQMLWKGFPGMERGAHGERFLYRHDVYDDTHSVLVQSVAEPDWRWLDNEGEGTIARVKDLDLAAIPAGSDLKFRLRANPVVRRKGYDDGKDRHIVVGSDRERIALRLNKPLNEIPSRDEHLVQWLERKAASAGFEIQKDEDENPLCVAGPAHDLVIRSGRAQQPTTLTCVDFDGILRVTDPAVFARTLQAGIGRGKGFGCGLLTVARL